MALASFIRCECFSNLKHDPSGCLYWEIVGSPFDAKVNQVGAGGDAIGSPAVELMIKIEGAYNCWACAVSFSNVDEL